MKKQIYTLALLLSAACTSLSQAKAAAPAPTGAEDRQYCVDLMCKIVDPVLSAVQEEKLDQTIPRHDWELNNKNCDIRTTSLQAVGRSISGLAPWLSLGADNTEEGKLRAKYIQLCQVALANITNPESPDYLFDKDQETYERIVHNAYIAYPLLLATEELWEPLTDEQKSNVIAALKTHRAYKPFNNNWILFSSLIEAAIWKLTGECDQAVLEKGVTTYQGWYLGDGMYGDGPSFHWDYYNSYVIHVLLTEILKVCKEKNHPLQDFYATHLGRAKRYSVIQEHLISPEGTFPVIGRSNVYRIGSLQLLGYMVYRNELPSELKPWGSTRAAMMAVTKRMMEAKGVFDENGWLLPGVVGTQLNARDVYTVTGALYMCTMGLTQLGLPANHPYWSEPASKWFQQRVWDGDDIPKQHEYYGK